MTELSVPLREYIEKIVCLKWEAQSDALKLARENLEKRLDSMNEIREQLNRQASTFVTKTEYDIIKTRFEDEIRSLQLSRAEMAGKSAVNVALVISVLSLLTTIIRYIL